MTEFLSFIAHAFSLIPTWLSAVFIALFVFVITYMCMIFFFNRVDEHEPMKSDSPNRSAEFDDLLATVLASKDRNHEKPMWHNEPEINIQKSVPASVVAAISMAVADAYPDGQICSIKTV